MAQFMVYSYKWWNNVLATKPISSTIYPSLLSDLLSDLQWAGLSDHHYTISTILHNNKVLINSFMLWLSGGVFAWHMWGTVFNPQCHIKINKIKELHLSTNSVFKNSFMLKYMFYQPPLFTYFCLCFANCLILRLYSE